MAKRKIAKRKSAKKNWVIVMAPPCKTKNNIKTMERKEDTEKKEAKEEKNDRKEKNEKQLLKNRMEDWSEIEKILRDTSESPAKSYSRQNAVAYAIYMMAGSYFASRTSNSRFRNLYLHYTEMPKEKQYESERRVMASVEKLGEDFLQKISALRCSTVCKRVGEELLMEFCTGGFEGLSFKIGKNGNFQLSPL